MLLVDHFRNSLRARCALSSQRFVDQRQAALESSDAAVQSLAVDYPDPVRLRGIRSKQAADVLERHLQEAHGTDDARGVDLIRSVPAVSGPGVHLAGHEQTGLVVVAKCRDGDSSQAGELADSEQVALVAALVGHAGNLASPTVGESRWAIKRGAETLPLHDEIGRLEWAAPQDWMCEPFMPAKTGLTVAEHQVRTVENYLELRSLAPERPFVPVPQGWKLDDYVRCVDLYYELTGIDLAAQPLVGIGSVCRR